MNWRALRQIPKFTGPVTQRTGNAPPGSENPEEFPHTSKLDSPQLIQDSQVEYNAPAAPVYKKNASPENVSVLFYLNPYLTAYWFREISNSLFSFNTD